MAAPTITARVKKTLANREPSTHGPTWALQQVGSYPGYTGRDPNVVAKAARDPILTSARRRAKPIVYQPITSHQKVVDSLIKTFLVKFTKSRLKKSILRVHG